MNERDLQFHTSLSAIMAQGTTWSSQVATTASPLATTNWLGLDNGALTVIRGNLETPPTGSTLLQVLKTGSTWNLASNNGTTTTYYTLTPASDGTVAAVAAASQAAATPVTLYTGSPCSSVGGLQAGHWVAIAAAAGLLIGLVVLALVLWWWNSKSRPTTSSLGAATPSLRRTTVPF